MSYILDALRKAERERQVSRVPTLATAHVAAESIPRSRWIWAVAGALTLSAVLLYGLFWAARRPDAVREAARPPVAVARPAASGASAVGAAPPPPLERTPPRGEAVATLPSGMAAERPPGSGALARPRAAHPVEDRRRAPPTGPSEASPAPLAAVAPPSPAPPRAAPGGAPATEARAAGAAAALPATPLAPGPSPEPGAVGTLPRLTLDVLVYSEVPAERLVFINGRKYVEGQAVDGDSVLELITPDGAVLRHQGRQLLLQPKLNPYVRPGSP